MFTSSSFARWGRLFLSIVVTLLAGQRALLAQTHSAGTGAIGGRVTAQSGTIPLGGAAIVVCDAQGRDVTSLASEADGRFEVRGLADGEYRVAISLEGFTPTTQSIAVVGGKTSDMSIDLAIAALTDTVSVTAPMTVATSADTIGTADSISSKETDQLAPGGGLPAALRLLASVIEVPGGVSIKGGRPTQAVTQLSAGTLAEPAMGLVHFTLPDDAIDSVTVLPNPYAVEYGRFSAGLVVIRTRRAGDTWKVRLNNLSPTFRSERHKDLYNVNGLAGWGPTFAIGGPIVKDRIFLEQTGQYRYDTDSVPSRPETELRTSHWFSSFSRVDVNAAPKHSLVLTAGFYPSVTTFASLGTFIPPDATVNVHDRVAHAAGIERAIWTDTLVSESTLQIDAYRTALSAQGTAPMQLWPDTTLGNFFNTQERTPSTFQWIQTFSGSANRWSALHLFKVGVDLLHNQYDGTSSSRPVLIYRPDGALARRLDFGPASTAQMVRSNDVALFAQDRVQAATRWYIEFGGRIDRDGILERWNVTPRIGAALLLNESGTSTVRGGYGLFYERTPSAAGAFAQFEAATETRFLADGVTPTGSPVRFAHVADPNLRTAESATWNLAYDYRLGPRWSFSASGLWRSGEHELVVDPIRTGQTGVLALDSHGQSRYRDVDVSLHYSRAPIADVNVSYVHSRAESNLNSFASFFDSMMWPVLGRDAYGTASTDVTHRLLARGHVLPAPRWLLVAVADWRTGLPYSVVNEALDFVGERNSRRLPNRFRLDLGVEHRFHIFKFEPWIGVRAYNALNSFMPTDVQANLASPAFGSFYNSEFRQFRLQVRFER
jgi:hypothetical protein